MKKILFLTGTRADFGKLKPLIERVENMPEFECQIFATGMHTLSRYGSTYDEINKAGFKNVYLYINQMASQNSAMDIVLANTIQGLGLYIREFSPDLIVVHGDRVEALAGAIVGALNNILVGHIEGGEVSGTVDELLRHAVSKLAHVHFVANADAKARLIQMGEQSGSIFVVGSPDVDVMLSDRLPSLADALRRYEIDFADYAIFSYHPVTTEIAETRMNVRAVVSALVASGRNFVSIYPNNDAGADIILEELAGLNDNPHFRFFPSLRFEYFLTLLKHARAIVGNSSAGIREAPVYGVATVNIGTRQRNRFKHVSIVNVPEDEASILAALEHLPAAAAPSLYFGDGKSADNFADALRGSQLWNIPCQKQFQDLKVMPPES